MDQVKDKLYGTSLSNWERTRKLLGFEDGERMRVCGVVQIGRRRKMGRGREIKTSYFKRLNLAESDIPDKDAALNPVNLNKPNWRNIL